MKWDPEQARRMKEGGATLKLIGKRFGIDPCTVKTRLDPEYAEQRRAGNRVAKRALRSRRSEIRYVIGGADNLDPDPVPDDLRTLTGRVFGDPLPGRSALDRRA